MSYLCYLCLSSPQIVVGGLMSYLCYLCLSSPQIVVGGFMSYLCYLCLSSHSGVKDVSALWLTSMAGIRGRNWIPFESTWAQPRFFVWSVLLVFLVWCVVVFILSSSYVLCLYSNTHDWLSLVSMESCNTLLYKLNYNNVYLDNGR
jgi:hypothetical protein